ncbi:MAG: cytoplasmic protein [Actinobacteria bacterium]|uniref:Unannotated protein n=1 Tax=freshwater metagenome TaxID=449393 RepID=A0A6J7DUI8_9ZZZZ|nr:cytoplasmic protein [Actinomycetota bacterium]
MAVGNQDSNKNEASDDAAIVAGDAYKVVLENEFVRILELRMEPGAKTEPHGHPNMVAVMIDGGTFRFGGPHSSTTPTDLEIPSGSVSFQPADRHTTENIGGAAVHGYLIELKG